MCARNLAPCRTLANGQECRSRCGQCTEMSVFFCSVSPQDATCDEERQRAEKIRECDRAAVRAAIRVEDIGHLMVTAGELAEFQQIDSSEEADPARRFWQRKCVGDDNLTIVNDWKRLEANRI